MEINWDRLADEAWRARQAAYAPYSRFAVGAALAAVAEGDAPVPPCGACLQVLAEFAPNLSILMATPTDRRTASLADLLPSPFGVSRPPGRPHGTAR